MSDMEQKKVSFGPYQADLDTQELWKYGRRLKIGGQPFGILSMLLAHPGQLITREELRAKLWSADTFVDFNQGLNAAVNKLRDCLSDSAEDPKYIETLPRRGYRFIGEVINGTTIAPLENARLMGASYGSNDSPSAMAPRLDEMVATAPWKEPAPVGTAAVPYRWLAFLGLALILTVLGYWALSPGHTRVRRSTGGPVFLGGSPRPAADPAFSPDGNRITFRQIESATGPSGIYVSTVGGEKITQLTSEESGCCPVWSPDGESIAYSRLEGDVQTIYVISAEGGLPRRLYSARQRSRRGELDWSPDGKFLAFSADAPEGGTRIVALSLANKEVYPLTAPSSEQVDWGPAYSPDGMRLAFLRSKTSGPPEEIFLAPAIGVIVGGGEHQLTSGESRIMGPPAWTSDSQSLVYSSSQGTARLWKISAKGGIAEAILSAEVPSWHPAIPRHSSGLAYQHILAATSIWRLDLDHMDRPDPRMVVISTNGRNEGPELSPNGKKLAFMSDRAGSMEIWISDPDGSYPIRLTNLGMCGSPQWSPDGRSIAFDAVRAGRPAVYVVDVGGGEPAEVAGGDSENMVPRWSRDGRWIYFGSNRTGQDEVWKVPSSGGLAKQVTHQGGFAAMESVDGEYLFYSKTRFDHPEIWQIPLKGGKETLLSSLVRPEVWANWSVSSKGIFFVDTIGEHLPNLEFFDLGTKQVQSLVTLNNDSFWLSSSEDGKTVWYGQAAHNESNIMVQPDFH